MKLKVGAWIVAGALFGAAALMPAVSEGRGGRGNAGGRGRCGQGWQQCGQQNQNCPQDSRQRRDGSCGNTACPQQGAPSGPCPGPAGNQCPGPQGGGDTPSTKQ